MGGLWLGIQYQGQAGAKGPDAVSMVVVLVRGRLKGSRIVSSTLEMPDTDNFNRYFEQHNDLGSGGSTEARSHRYSRDQM